MHRGQADHQEVTVQPHAPPTSPCRMRSTTCSAASTPASGFPTPSPVKPRRGRRRALGTPCWKLSSQARTRMSARDSPQPPPACLQASVHPFSENENRCHCPSSWLLLLLLLPPSPGDCPLGPALQHSSKSCFESRGFTAYSDPISIMPKAQGYREGQRSPAWSTGEGGGSQLRGLLQLMWALVPLFVCCLVFYMVNGSDLPIKDFRCSAGPHKGCWHSSSLWVVEVGGGTW